MKLATLAILAACGGPSTEGPAERVPASAVPTLLHQVGTRPRGYASVSIAEGWLRSQLEAVVTELPGIGSKLSDCGIDLAKLARLRIAIGEPLRIAAEIDGAVDVNALTCVVGDSVIAQLASLGVAIHDRPGGIAVDYNVEHADARDAAIIAGRCATANCIAVRFGPAARSIWLSASVMRTMRFQLEGPGIGAAGTALNAALGELRATVPALASVKLDVRDNVLTFDAATMPNEKLAVALRTNLIEAFRIPSSSMVPTLQIGDHVFAVKGPLLGAPTAGDIFVYRTPDDSDYIFRYITGGPHTVTESDAGIAVDGKLLRREVIAAHANYRDVEYDSGNAFERSGAIVREYAGSRSYLTFRSGPAHQTGPWLVPEGTLFLLGDNRNNANDSRYDTPTPMNRLRGRAVAIWWASRDGIPDWDRIGTPID